MKKSFQFIALAAIVLPLLIACNKKSTNEPENPNSFDSMDEWFDYWTTGDKKDALEVNAENMVGTWERVGEVEVTKSGEINHTLIPSVMGYRDDKYLQLQASRKFAVYFVHDKEYGNSEKKEDVTEKKEGTWKVSNKQILYTYANSDEAKETVYLLESDRLVVTVPGQAWRGDGTTSTYYTIYSRINALPEIP